MDDTDMNATSGDEQTTEAGTTALTSPDEPDTKGDESEEKQADSGEEKQQDDSKKDETPADWELEPVEGFDADKLKDFGSYAKEQGLSREQAEAMVKWQQRDMAAWGEGMVQQRKDWLADLHKDPDFGGKHYDATIADAKRALQKFDDDGSIRTMLEQTGYGDNSAIIKMMARIGRNFREEKSLPGSSGDQMRPLEERLYK